MTHSFSSYILTFFFCLLIVSWNHSLLIGQSNMQTRGSQFPQGVFVSLSSGKLLTGKSLSLSKNKRKLSLDGMTHRSSDITVYQASKGIYGITPNGMHVPIDMSGKLNGFSKGKQLSTILEKDSRSVFMTNGTKNMFYNTGLGPLKKLTARNLRRDIAGFEESKKLLNRARVYRISGTILMVSGAVYALSSLLNDNQLDDTFAISGIAFMGSGYFMFQISAGKVIEAFKLFNES